MDTPESSTPTIAIVGRPNVGKSSLFNAILKKRAAIVHHESGITRDRILAPARWKQWHFQLVDTGGLANYTGESKQVSIWDREIRAQVEAAIAGADLLIFTTDVQSGVTPLDGEIAAHLRESGKPVLLVPNKSDNSDMDLQAESEFTTLGFENIFPVSCLHRRGLDDLLDHAVSRLPAVSKCHLQDIREKKFRIAVVGRPNVGKSSFVNRMLGEKRVMVSEVAGTTRDAVDIDILLDIDGEKLHVTLIDTAGLRKRAKVDTAVETFSMSRAQSAIASSDLVIFLIEASASGVTAQDKRIARIIQEAGKGCIIAANKWDLCPDMKPQMVERELRHSMPFMNHAPLFFTCALTGLHFKQLLSMVLEIRTQMSMHLPTAVINQIVGDAIRKTPPPIGSSGKALKVYYATMKGSTPPTFILFVNNPRLCAPHYLGYLSNTFQKAFGYKGLPVIVQLRERPRKPRP